MSCSLAKTRARLRAFLSRWENRRLKERFLRSIRACAPMAAKARSFRRSRRIKHIMKVVLYLRELWALTRARPIVGPQQAEFLEMVQRIWREAGQRPNLFADIHAMTERIRRDRSSGAPSLDFKTETGGMIEAEFLVQALQMRSGIWNPTWTGSACRTGATRPAGAERSEPAKNQSRFSSPL